MQSQESAKAPLQTQAAGKYAKLAYLLTAAFFGIFMAFNTAQGLETNIVENKELAHLSLAILYACFTIVSTVAPVAVQRCGPKIAMVCGALPYAYLIGCYLAKRQTYAISIPAFAAVGIGASILWAAEGVYLGRCAILHAQINGEKEEDVTSRFNGVFFSSFQFTGGTGMVLASLIYTNVSNQVVAKTALFSVMLGVTVVGLILFCSLRQVKPVDKSSQNHPFASDRTSSLKVNSRSDHPESTAPPIAMIPLSATLKQAFCDPPMALLVPIIFYNGMSLAFFFSDYRLFYADETNDDGKITKKRLMSDNLVGFVTATFYFTDSAFSLIFGKLASIIGRRGVVLIAFIAHAAFYSILIGMDIENVLKRHSIASYAVVFSLPILFGIGDSVWMSQIPAILQSPAYLPKEMDRDTAMSNLKLWQSLGLATQFLIGIHVSMPYVMEISIIVAVFVIACSCLLYTNWKVRSIDSDVFSHHPIHSSSGDELYDAQTYY